MGGGWAGGAARLEGAAVLGRLSGAAPPALEMSAGALRLIAALGEPPLEVWDCVSFGSRSPLSKRRRNVSTNAFHGVIRH